MGKHHQKHLKFYLGFVQANKPKGHLVFISLFVCLFGRLLVELIFDEIKFIELILVKTSFGMK